MLVVKLCVRPFFSLGSTSRVTVSPNGTDGTIGTLSGEGTGVGTGPSTPTRNAPAGSVEVGLQFEPGIPMKLQRGAFSVSVWPNATPICQLPRLTLFCRSNTRA